MGYVFGLFKYWVKGPFTNPIAFYIYGAGILALMNAFPHFIDGNFVQMVFQYFFIKYLPPTSVGQVIMQVIVGTLVAGLRWFVFTPR
jgi:hypothetical protein